MTSTSAQELLESHDCVVPGCVYEAESGSDRCRVHLAPDPPSLPPGPDEPPLRAFPRLTPLDANPEPDDGRPVCRTEGCNNKANREHSRGMYSGLCEEVCIPRRRKAAREAAQEQHENAAELFTPKSADDVVDAMTRWYREHGSLPKSTDWPRRSKTYPSYEQCIRHIAWLQALRRTADILNALNAPPPAAEAEEDDRTFAEVAQELEDAHNAMEAETDRFIAATKAFAAHPLTQALADELGSDWLNHS